MSCFLFVCLFVFFISDQVLVLFSPKMKMSLFPEFSLPFNGRDDADFNLAIYEMQNGPHSFVMMLIEWLV